MPDLPAATPPVATPPAPAAPTLHDGGIADHLRSLFDAVSAIFDRGNVLTDPDHLVAGIQKLGVVWGIVFVIVGLLCLFNGYKWYRVTTIGLALFLGLFAGYILGEQIGAPFVVAGCLGALCFALAFPMLKFVVAALGGLAGAFIGANTWEAMAATVNRGLGPETLPVDAYPAGALAGLLFCGMLAFILFKLSVVLYTSVSGSTLAVIGSLALLLSIDPWQQAVITAVTESPLVMPLLVFVPAVIGLVLQHSEPKRPMAPAAKPA
ncbi:ABC-2 transporter permease [Phycisphaera mikurensis]|uniref:DUF4203 domain-containing protein n=1 Tax=Phycisphaera mikurensis (strain NBRC 102666 / KCTC 22515 / FYK2301M01) TaxID=1142394 RepID=I0IER4_PHYMF|nr:hypothetical protein [Phycisphaera mikurensis]MBB6441547.1 hypothetical protein [Phycisphaera mikurensis]BAM03752.1 hypothetical protein PSMK_15930 [Phycisphaera mikurensis NBRC 102666]